MNGIINMKQISLAPYPGFVLITNSKEEYEGCHLRLFDQEDPIEEGTAGRVSMMIDNQFVVYAKDELNLIHELSHVVFYLFKNIGINPSDSDGEAFSYMLCHLIKESK